MPRRGVTRAGGGGGRVGGGAGGAARAGPRGGSTHHTERGAAGGSRRAEGGARGGRGGRKPGPGGGRDAAVPVHGPGPSREFTRAGAGGGRVAGAAQAATRLLPLKRNNHARSRDGAEPRVHSRRRGADGSPARLKQMPSREATRALPSRGPPLPH